MFVLALFICSLFFYYHVYGEIKLCVLSYSSESETYGTHLPCMENNKAMYEMLLTGTFP